MRCLSSITGPIHTLSAWTVCLSMLMLLLGASPSHSQDPTPPQDPADGFTMMIATYKRTHLLPDLLNHLTTEPPPSLRHIVIIWQNVGEPLPDFLEREALDERLKASGRTVAVTVRKSKKNSMNERFRPLLDWGEPLRTEAVMIMDDDLVLKRDTLEWGFRQFRLVNPLRTPPDLGRIVGFTARDYSFLPDGNVTYSILPKAGYSLVLSNAAWFRREWFEMYWAKDMAEMRDYVDEVFNCDDLLVNFLVSNFTHRPPLLLQPTTPLRHIPGDGLWNKGLKASTSSSSSFSDATPTTTSSSSAEADPTTTTTTTTTPTLTHFEKRPICLRHFFDYYAPQGAGSRTGYPLVRTDTAVSQDIQDHARQLAVGESWEHPFTPQYQNANILNRGGDNDDDEEEEEEEEEEGEEGEYDEEDDAEFQEMLDNMSQEELAQYVRELEAEQLADEEDIKALREELASSSSSADSGSTGNKATTGKIDDEL